MKNRFTYKQAIVKLYDSISIAILIRVTVMDRTRNEETSEGRSTSDVWEKKPKSRDCDGSRGEIYDGKVGSGRQEVCRMSKEQIYGCSERGRGAS